MQRYLKMNEEFNSLSQFEKEELLKQLKVSWTFTSNAIEGNTLTLGDTAFIVEHGLTVSGKSLNEHNEVLGHMKALDIVYGLLKKEFFTQDDLFLLHKAIQTEIVIDYEKPIGAYKMMPNGRWLNVDNKSQYFYYPHPDHVAHLMKLWFDTFSNIDISPENEEEAVRRYTDMHISFAAIHPFWDGNGRLARLISNLPLLKSGYLPIIINNEHRQEYITLLSTYNLTAKTLNIDTEVLLEKNDAYEAIFSFFKKEYKYAKKLLENLRESRKKL